MFSHEVTRIFPLLREAAYQANRILEVGAGSGRMIRLLQAEGASGCFCAVDITQRLRESPSVSVLADARALPFCSGSFDLVYSLGVVEHFPETARAIAEQARTTAKGGIVLMTTPHLGPQTVLRWLLYLIRSKFGGASFEIMEGRNLSLPYVRALFDTSGLIIEEMAGTGPVLYLSMPDVLNRILNRLMPESRYGSFLYVLARKPC